MFRQYAKKSFFHLRALRHIRSALTDGKAVSIAAALIQSRLDYSNSVCFGISACNLAKLYLSEKDNFGSF